MAHASGLGEKVRGACRGGVEALEKTRVKRLDRLRLRLVDESCATCLPGIRRMLEKADGVEWVGANPILDLIFVDFDPDLIAPEQILRMVERSGFKAVRASG